MKLYTAPGSRYGSRCQIQIAAKGLDVVATDILAFPLPESYRAINPLMKVPALDIGGGEILPESHVICEYLEDLGQGPSLRPSAPRDHARMNLIIRLFELYYDPAVMKLFPFLFVGAQRDTTAIAAIGAEISTYLEMIAARLDGGKYAVGGRLSLADCALMPPFAQAKIFGPHLGLGDPIAANTKISAYYDATRKDPHVAGVLDQLEPAIKTMLNA